MEERIRTCGPYIYERWALGAAFAVRRLDTAIQHQQQSSSSMALRGRTATSATTLASLLLLVVLALPLLVSPSDSREIEPRSAAHPEKGTGFWASRKQVIRPDRAADLAPPSPRPNTSVPGGPSG